jgi:hypothetical protein
MSHRELFQRLLEEGVSNATYAGIQYAVATGRIDRPPKDAFGNFLYEERHLEQARTYFATPRKRGRPAIRAVAEK